MLRESSDWLSAQVEPCAKASRVQKAVCKGL